MRLDIPVELRADRLARVSVLREAVAVLMSEEFVSGGADLHGLSLAEAIVRAPGAWDTWEEWEQFNETARQMFPN